MMTQNSNKNIEKVDEKQEQNSSAFALFFASAIVNKLWLRGLITDEEKIKIDKKNSLTFMEN